MKCPHCDEPMSNTRPIKRCPLRGSNPTDHTHNVCDSCFERMTSDAPPEPTVTSEDATCPSCGDTGRRATARSANGAELTRHERSGTRCTNCKGTGHVEVES